MSLAVLIFGVFYPLVALAIACAGTFGISATKSERIEEAERTQKYPGDRTWFKWRYHELLYPLIGATVAVSLLWPIGVPLYLAWKKGSFINDALDKREAAITELRKRAA